MNSEWSQEEVVYLIDCWNKGHSSSQIAKELGRTRVAIVGKIDRLRRKGIELRCKADAAPARKSKTRRRPKKPTPLSLNIPAPKEPPVFRPSLRISILDVGKNACSWIDDDKGADGLATCCGHPVDPDSSFKFCPYHRAVATDGEFSTAKPVEDDGEDDVPSEIEQEAA
ncbi:MAG: HTH domain-containing protein [Roseibium sp.]|nr:HTH domain-containing protein [Roseibium sp.]